MRLIPALLTLTLLSACAAPGGSVQPYRPVPGQGRYIYPENQRPQPMEVTPLEDMCRARLYQNLRGQNIGGVHVAVIAGDKRIIKPAEVEVDLNDFIPEYQERPPLVDVTDLMAGQPLYTSQIRTGVYRGQLGPDRPDRLTLELDEDGYIEIVECR